MMFEMRFQMLALAASLAASAFAGFVLAVPPTEAPARPDRLAAASDLSRGSAAIFTEFGNEMAWEDGETEHCVPPPASAHSGTGLLDQLVHHISEDSQNRQPGRAGKPATACAGR